MTKFVAALILPPLNLLLLATLAWVLAPRRPRLSRGLLIVTLIGAYLSCTPAVTGVLMQQLESEQPAPTDLAQRTAGSDRATAIVVLGGGTYLNAPEYGRDTVGRRTLERLRWAAQLHRKLRIPVLVTGGRPTGNASSEAEQMRDVLIEDFGVPVRWLETQSHNTFESAFNTLGILRAESVSRLILVTHAVHMPRALLVFEHVGFDVIAAPTGFTTRPPATILDYFPSAGGLNMARNYLHELVGIGWYHLRLMSAS